MHIPLFVYVGASLPKVQRLFCKFSEFVFQKFNLRKVNQVELVKENGCLIPKASENSERARKVFAFFVVLGYFRNATLPNYPNFTAE